MITRKTFDKTVYCGFGSNETDMCIMVHVSCDINLNGGINRRSADFAEVYFKNHEIERSEHRSKAQAIELWNKVRPGKGKESIEYHIDSLTDDLKVEATNFFGKEKFNDFKAEFAALLKKYNYDYYDPEVESEWELTMPSVYDNTLFTEHFIEKEHLPK